MMSQVWTYSSGLEKESSRFSQPGDFFTYIIFLGLVILVRSSTLFMSSLSTPFIHSFHGYPSLAYLQAHLTYLPAQPLPS